MHSLQRHAGLSERRFKHACVKCFSNVSPEVHAELVRGESAVFLDQMAIQQTWSGSETPPSLLILPKVDDSALPKYKEEPEHLDPMHCRLCLRSFSEDVTNFMCPLAKRKKKATVGRSTCRKP